MMKKFILISIVLLFANITFSQVEKDSLIINSLTFLDKKLHLNFEKAKEYILVFFEDDYFIIDKYCNNAKSNIIRAKIIYKLQEIDNERYSFSLNWAGTLQGTFYYKNGKISKLRYVDITN